MDNKPDIYARPAAKEKESAAPSVDVSKYRRPAMWRTFVLFLLLMLGLLAFTAILLHMQEQRRDLVEVEAQREEDLAFGTEPARPRPAPDAEAPLRPLFEFEPLVPLPAAPPATVDQGQVVDAMRQVRLGADYLREREFDRAEELAREALRIWPDMEVALRMLGVIFLNTGRFGESVTVLNRALQQNPANAEVYNNLGIAYLHQGNLPRAAELLETALDLDPDRAVSSLNLGFVYLALHEHDLAVDYIAHGLERFPQSVEARNNLAVAYIRLHRFPEARQHLQVLIDGSPSLAFPYFNMAISHALDRDFESAMEWIERGSRICSPRELQEFLADPDFDIMRSFPAFMSFIDDHFGLRHGS